MSVISSVPLLLCNALPITLISTANFWDSVNGSSLTINKPSGTVDGDLMIAVLNGTFTLSNTYSCAGWSTAYNKGSSNGLTLMYKIAASEPASWTFTATNNNKHGGVVITYRSAVYDTVGTADTTFTANTLDAPSITASGGLLLATFNNDNSGSTFGAVSGMTQIYNHTGDANNNLTLSIYSQVIASGATGTRSCTLTGTQGNATGILMSIK